MNATNKILILSIIICLAGLVWVQTTMLRSAYIQSEKSFDQNVQIALQNVTHSLLKQNIENRLVQNLDTTLGDAKNKITIKVNKNTFGGANEIKSNIDKQIIIHSNARDKGYKAYLRDSIKSSQDINHIIDNLLGRQDENWVKKKLMDFDFKEALRANLLKLELPTDFEYAILDEGKKALKKSEGFLKKGKIYEKSLLQNALFSANGKLLLTFNSRGFSILKEILIPLCLSILFLVIASGLFVYIFGLYKKQKQVALARDDFINSMSHELKTPLATIGVSIENLKYQKENPEIYLGIIQEENERMQHYIENILQLAQMDKTELLLMQEITNVTALVKGVVEKEAVKIKEKGGEVIVHAKEDMHANLDPLHFKNALHNIIDNAVKYNNKKPIVEVELTKEDEKLKISIRDNGLGIDKTSLKHVFDKFYRAQTGNIYNVKGTGIGLSYAKHVINRHGGEITVQSETGKGSTFTIHIPIE